MYSETPNKVTFFQNADQKSHSSDKCLFATVSEAVKDEREERKWRYDSWNARFVGQACSKAASLTDKTKLELKKWATFNEYIKPHEGEGKGHSSIYMMIYDFDIIQNAEE